MFIFCAYLASSLSLTHSISACLPLFHTLQIDVSLFISVSMFVCHVKYLKLVVVVVVVVVTGGAAAVVVVFVALMIVYVYIFIL